MIREKKKSSFNSIIVVIGLTLLAKIIGLLRDTFISQKVGAGFDSDTYLTGISLTTLIFLGIGSGIATSIIPIIARYKKDGTKSESVSHIVNLILIVTAALTLIYFVFAPYVVNIMVHGFSQEKIEQTTTLVRIMVPSLMFIAMQYLFVGVLQANERFVLPTITSFPYNLLFFIYLAFGFMSFGIEGMAVITTIGWFMQFALLLIVVVKNKLIPFKFGIDFKDVEIKNFLLGILPIIFVTLTHQMNIIIDNRMASQYVDGSVSSIYFGNLLFVAVVTTTVYGITAVMFPKFNNKFLEDNKEGLFQSVINVLRSILLLLLPMSIGMILVGPHIISLVFERGLFDAADTRTTVIAFTGYTSFMLAFGFVDVLNKAYYTLGNRRTPLLISITIICINIVTNIILVKILGFAGIAIATSIAFYIGALLSFILFCRLNKTLTLSRFTDTFIKTVVAAVVMGVGVYVANTSLVMILDASIKSRLFIVIIDISIGIVLYAMALLVLKEQLVSHAMSQLKNRITRRNN